MPHCAVAQWMESMGDCSGPISRDAHPLDAAPGAAAMIRRALNWLWPRRTITERERVWWAVVGAHIAEASKHLRED